MKYLIFFTIIFFGLSFQKESCYIVKKIEYHKDFRVIWVDKAKEHRILICTNPLLNIQTGKRYSICTIDRYEYYKEEYNIDFSIDDVGQTSWTSDNDITIKSENGSEILFIKSLRQCRSNLLYRHRVGQ
jgi:hypothetical protein